MGFVGGIPVSPSLIGNLLIGIGALFLYFIIGEVIIERIWRLISGKIENDIEVTSSSLEDSVHSGYNPSTLHASGQFDFKNISRFDLKVTTIEAEISWGEAQASSIRWELGGFQSSSVEIENPKKKGDGWVSISSNFYPDPMIFDKPQYITINGIVEFEGDRWWSRGRIKSQKEIYLREQLSEKSWEGYISDLTDD